MRTPIPASQIAFSLQHEFIAHLDQEVVAGLAIDPVRLREYESKVLLYRLAAVMWALFQEEAKHPQFGRVREELEKLVFHPGPTDENRTKLDELKVALVALDDLLDTKKTMSWARAWLIDVGVDESNPAVLMLFGSFWKNFLVTTQTALREFEPL